MSEEPQHTGDQMEAAAPVATAVAEPQGEQRQVPLDALQAERQERQALQDELRMVKENMQLMMQRQMSEPQTSKQDEWNGYDDQDVLTVGEFKKKLSEKEAQMQQGIEELRLQMQHPDYSEVVTTYLPEVLKQNPGLGKRLKETKDFELAYHLAKNSDAYRKAHAQKTYNDDAQRIVENANQAGSLSSVGQMAPISEAKRWKDMSPEEFQQAARKNLGYI